MKIIDANGFLNIQKKNNVYTIINDTSNIYYILLHDCYESEFIFMWRAYNRLL